MEYQPKVPIDFTGTFHHIYTVRVMPSTELQLRWIPGGESQVKLSLALRDHVSLKRALVCPEYDEAILDLHMRWDDAVKIYQELEKLVEQMGLPLPQTNE